MLRRNVLILHAGALGDFVLAWPLMLALGRLHPQSRIIVVTHGSKGALAEAALRVESADIDHGWHGIYASGGDVPEQATKLLEGAHSIYSFVSRQGDAATANLRRIAGADAKVVTLAPRPPETFDRHSTDHLISQLDALPAVKTGTQQMLKSIALRGVGVGRSATGDVVIHPGSGSPAKCWPLQKYVKLIQRFKRKRAGVRVLLGEVELERFADADVKTLETVAEVRRPASYLALFNELHTASTFIGNDSGPSHLAGIIGVPTVALFGPTNPAVWRPLGPRVKVLRKEPIDDLSVDEVFHAAGTEH
jgi:ADP-heptose:LPS heptosyltransferase